MNITKPVWRRRVAMACVGALAALGWTTVGDAARAATDLPAAQFASVSGSGACAANEQAPATYTGTFAAKLQMTELLKPFETQVKSEADAGHFPWDKETVSTSASFYYTVTFPQGTTVQAASASESSSMIASVTESAVSSDSLTHTFKIKLNDVNWAEIYAAYQQDTSNPSAHTVDVTIPYSIAANSADEAKAIAARNVTATGSFSFYPSGTWGRFGVGLQTFNMDAFSAPVASDMSAFPCLTPAAPVEPITVSQAGTLPGDLLGAVDSGAVDTEHDAVAVAAGQSSPVSLTGALYTDSIRDQMAAIETQYSQTTPDFSNIALSNVDFGFEAVLTLPEGMAYTDASKSATLSGSDDFKVSSVVVSGQTATVKFALTDAAKAKVRTYADLKGIVDAVASPLQVTVAGVVFTSASSADTEYTVKGSVSGSFAALASKSAATGGREIQFNLTWTGEQKTGLEDAKTQPGITYTVKYKAAPVTVSQAGTLPGDLLGAVDSGAVDTEHDAVAVAAGQSSPVSLTGALYTDSIRDQMAAIETQYSQTTPDFSNIALSNVDFGFEAVLTLPEGMAYTDASKSATLSGSDDFKVSSVVVSGQTATVKFALTDAAKAKVRTYADLKGIVDAVASPLQVTVAGVVFTSASSADTEYTVKGSVSGSFAALASKSAATGGREIQFNLTWTGEQKTGLEDAKTQPGITYTVKYKAAPVTVSQAGTLPGDLLGAVDSGAVDTEHDAVAVAAGQSSPVSLTGALYTDSIRDQMAAIETQYSQTTPDFSNIALSNVDFGFEAVLTLPEGMAYTDASKSATLSGSDDFKVSSVVVSGQTATVKFALTDAAKAKVRTYADLKGIVDAVASPLQVTVAGVVFTSASSADTEYTVKGSVSGSFAALASKSAATGGREIQFNLTWTGEQKTGLEDAKTQPGITYTVKYKAAPVEPTKPTEPTKNTTKTPSTSQTLAKTGFSGALVGGLGMLFAAAGAVAVRQKRD